MTSRQQFEQWFATVHESGSYANSHLFERVVSDTRYCSMEVEYAWLAYQKSAQDAERYRWLRAQPCNISDTPRIDVVYWTCEKDDSVNEGEGLRMEALDAAIDKELGK